MGHKWISTDNGVDCYRCGTSIDYPWLNPDSEVWDSPALSIPGEGVIGKFEAEQMESEIHLFIPNCSGPTDNRAHHFFGLGSDKDDHDHLIMAIECHYGDAHIGWETDLAYVPRYCNGE